MMELPISSILDTPLLTSFLDGSFLFVESVFLIGESTMSSFSFEKGVARDVCFTFLERLTAIFSEYLTWICELQSGLPAMFPKSL